MIELYANVAKTTLAAAITNTATSATLSAGTGALFPNPAAGQFFRLSLKDAATGTVREVVYVTARSTDTITMIRGQEGTTAVAWNSGDIAQNNFTAGAAENLIQPDQLQTGAYEKVTSVGGTANAITATLASNLTTLSDGMQIVLTALNPNTGAVTLNLTVGTTVIGALPVVKLNNAPLDSNDIPVTGYPVKLIYSSAFGAYVMLNPANVAALFAAVANTRTGHSYLANDWFWLDKQNGLFANVFTFTVAGVGPTSVTFAQAFTTAILGGVAAQFDTSALPGLTTTPVGIINASKTGCNVDCYSNGDTPKGAGIVWGY